MFPALPKNKKSIYLDHAAATPVDSRVRYAMQKYFLNTFANASSLHSQGVGARKAVDAARKKIADSIGAQSDTVLFTSGATESNNLAILGLLKNTKERKHIITSRIEHDSVLAPIMQLKKQGHEVTFLDVDENGFVDVDQLKKTIKKNTVLVSVMYANNEIGSIEPIADIGREILKWRKVKNTLFPYFHCDATQAAGTFDLSVEKLHVDLMTLNSGKIYGPKGVGALYKRRGLKLEPLLYGGQQEFSLRAGTENVAGIVGFARAFEIAQSEKEKTNKQIEILRNYFWTQIQKEIKNVIINGPVIPSVTEESRLPNNLNIFFDAVEAEALMLYLDSYGIFCSTGSACSTESNEPSHVLKALGYTDERAKRSIRFTLGKDTTKQDIDYVMKYLPKIVEQLRLIF
jgi:cysteine desulfurase